MAAHWHVIKNVPVGERKNRLLSSWGYTSNGSRCAAGTLVSCIHSCVVRTNTGRKPHLWATRIMYYLDLYPTLLLSIIQGSSLNNHTVSLKYVFITSVATGALCSWWGENHNTGGQSQRQKLVLMGIHAHPSKQTFTHKQNGNPEQAQTFHVTEKYKPSLSDASVNFEIHISPNRPKDSTNRK